MFIYRLWGFLICILILFIFHPGGSSAQERFSEDQTEFIQHFQQLQEFLPRERIHLHTDRQWYFEGDRIWFSIYVTAGRLNVLSRLSKVVYVEVFDPEGVRVDRHIAELENGRASGSILLDTHEEFVGGNFEIKAFTGWMLNFHDAYHFNKILPVRSFSGTYAAADSLGPNIFDIRFFPESGHLVDGLQSRIAFKAVGADGRSADVTGTIVDDLDNRITEFETEHSGMGSFYLTPESGRRYSAITTNGTRIPLPEVLNSGLNMQVDTYDQLFSIYTDLSAPNASGPFMIFGHVRGTVYFAEALEIADQSAFTMAQSVLFPTGIVHFTILSPDGRPVAERLAFNFNDVERVSPELRIGNTTLSDTTDVPVFAPRQRIALNFDIKGVDGSDLPASASIAVFDDLIEPYEYHSGTILSQLLLETEVNGHIEQPGYYFSKSEKAREHLDLLLMTQGWRAYDMQAVFERAEHEISLLPEMGFAVSGTVKTRLRKRPLENASVVFSIGDGHDQMFLLDTDKDGRFYLDELDVHGSQLITVRANDERGRDRVYIELEDQFAHLPGRDTEPVFQDERMPEPHTDPDRIASQEYQNRAVGAQTSAEEFVETQMQMLLDEIVITETRLEDEHTYERPVRSFASSSQRLDLDERPLLRDLPIEQILAQMPGVRAVSQEGGETIIVDTGASGLSGSLPPPMFIVDGIVTTLDVIRNLTSSEIQTVDVYRRAHELALYGSQGTGGVIRIQTRSGGGLAEAEMRGLITAFVEGYHPPTQFYAPRYGITVPRDSEQMDNRITLYWDPKVNTADEGVTAEFWTNDMPGEYRIVIEGITETGQLFHKTALIINQD